MINLTRLLCDVPQPADALRYGIGPTAPRSDAERKPIVVWNITRRCNLRCAHCYSDSTSRHYKGDLTLPQFRATIDDLAEFGVTSVLLSGGESLIHPRFFDIADYANECGLRLPRPRLAALRRRVGGGSWALPFRGRDRAGRLNCDKHRDTCSSALVVAVGSDCAGTLATITQVAPTEYFDS